MLEKDETVKTQSDEAGSAVLSDTILESQLEEIKRDSRGKVSGKFLRLTDTHEDVPVYVRCDSIVFFTNTHNHSVKGHEYAGCYISGKFFNHTVSERAEEVLSLISQVEGEYSANELAETLIALLVVAGTDPSEARALLSTAPREALVKRINALGERLTKSHYGLELAQSILTLSGLTTDEARLMMLSPDLQAKLLEAVNTVAEQLAAITVAGERLYRALGGTEMDPFWEDFPASFERCIDQAIERLRTAEELRTEKLMLQQQMLGQALNAKAAVDLTMPAGSDSEAEQAMSRLWNALGVTEEELQREEREAAHPMQGLTTVINRCVDRLEALKHDAAAVRRQEQTIESQQEEIERQQEEIEKQRRDIEAFRADAAAYLKNSDELSRQVSELTSACEKIFEALSFTDADYAREGVDYRTEQAGLVRMLEVAAVAVADLRVDKVMAQHQLFGAALNQTFRPDNTLPEGAQAISEQDTMRLFDALGMTEADLLREEKEAGHPLIACGRLFAKAADRIEQLKQDAASSKAVLDATQKLEKSLTRANDNQRELIDRLQRNIEVLNQRLSVYEPGQG